MSDSINHGDSLVSVFSMDRVAADKIRESQQNARPSVVDFEKEELRERVAALEEKLANRELDLAKSHKLIKGLRKLVPNSDNVSLSATESPSLIGDRLARERANLLAELEKTSSGSVVATEESFQPQAFANATAGIDLVMNGSLCPDDLESMKSEFARFRDLCTKMFQQLQGTASFLEKLIRHLENSEDDAAKKLLAKIRAIHLDLNTSMQNASVMMDSAQNAEVSLSTALERSVRVSMAPNSEVIALTDKIIQAEKKYAELENKYAEIVQNVASLNTQNENLRQELREATAKAESFENIVHDKENQLSILLEEKRLTEERAQTLVPEILQEMTDIKTTLEEVSKNSKYFQRKSQKQNSRR